MLKIADGTSATAEVRWAVPPPYTLFPEEIGLPENSEDGPSLGASLPRTFADENPQQLRKRKLGRCIDCAKSDTQT
jgi:hypothetical protein